MNIQELDLRALRYVDTVNDNLICCICQNPFIEPVISHCGHTFCEYCIKQSLETSSHCPIDRSTLSDQELEPAAKIIHNMVNELQVYCPRHEQGCLFIGQRQFLPVHLNDCPFSLGPCQLEACQALVFKKDQKKHVESCEYRSVNCIMCHKEMCAYELEDHYDHCPAETIQCIDCGQTFERIGYVSHGEVCLEREVRCEHVGFGCDWQDRRRQLEEHLSYCPFEAIKTHLKRQEAIEQQIRQDLQQLHRENESLRRQQSESRQKIETLTRQLDGMFPGHFVMTDIPDELRQESVMSENQRMSNELETLSANMASLELKQNMALMTETFRLQEELQSIRAICHGLRMQMHYVLMDRRPAGARSRETEGLNRIQSVNSQRQETKL